MLTLLCLIKHKTLPPPIVDYEESTDNKYEDITLHGGDVLGTSHCL